MVLYFYNILFLKMYKHPSQSYRLKHREKFWEMELGSYSLLNLRKVFAI